MAAVSYLFRIDEPGDAFSIPPPPVPFWPPAVPRKGRVRWSRRLVLTAGNLGAWAVLGGGIYLIALVAA